MKHPLTLGVDTGGTFTDFVWLDAHGRLQIHKQLSTPHDPSQAILAGVDHLAIPETAVVVHGSTVATNALLERKGARTALITTAGFADVLAIGRQHRPDIYALVPQKPDPLVPRQWRFEVNERVTAQGDILTPLDPASLQPILDHLATDNIESIAVCLLFSFLRPEHEQLIRKEIEERRAKSEERNDTPLAPRPLPLHISLSSDILPEYREFERTATTVINAYVAPLMSRYLARLADGLQPRRLTVMQSNGGVINGEKAATQAARTALSGPAGGVVGAQFVAQVAGYDHIITFDMGGTSTDVALCPGKLPTTAVGEIADLPLRLPIIDIHTVGAGGGSLAHVDAGGALHVGPQSAGADPGPACYGRGVRSEERGARSEERRANLSPLALGATTTDANLVLGRLDADHFLGGTMKLDVAAAHEVLSELAGHMGASSAETAAWGVIQVANANMERAIRRISVERGHDPRRFTLVPFGGAGPLHACEMAANLQIPRVLVPAVPGVLSALGMLVAAPTKDYSRTVMAGSGEWRVAGGEWLAAQFAPLEGRALAEMAAEGHDPETITLQHSLDMRYVGQSHELTIPLPSPFASRSSPIASLLHTAHEARYGYQQPQAEVEIVNVRLTAVAPITPPPLPQHPTATTDAGTALMGEKSVWFNQQPMPTKLYDRAKLQAGHRFAGPAIVFQYDTTTVIPPEWETAVDAFGNLLLTHTERME
jgi:N-methylhydantoinase A